MAADKPGTSISNASQTALVRVWATVVPETVDEVSDAIKRSNGRLSVSSARYSPDTQFALTHALHIDMSRLDRVIRFEPMDALIRVQAGIRWHELLRFIQPHGFAVKVMPRFANFSVGGSVASNAHGHYVGVGPMSSSIRSLRAVLADGASVEVSRTDKPDLFAALVGGFGGVGIVVEVELELAQNTRVMRKSLRMPADQYVDHFKARIATDPGAVFHTAEFYAPAFRRLRASTWVASQDQCTNDQPLNRAGVEDPLRKVFDWSRPTSWFGRMREELIVEPIRFSRKAVHWRNYEASHDVVEFDARIHEDPTLELQEYVVAPAHVTVFLGRLREIVARYKIPAVHLSIRHYGHCHDSYLSLASMDSFAFLLAVRSKPTDALEADYGVWSRELVDAALEGGGSFNPAYQMHATAEQFSRVFARRAELLLAKKKYDPANRFGNGLWTHYLDEQSADSSTPGEASEFRAAFGQATVHDAVYRLLAECGPRGHAPRMLGLLQRMSQGTAEDELIYRNMRSTLLKWRSSAFASLTMRSSNWEKALHRRLARYSRDQLLAAAVSDGRQLQGMVEIASRGSQFSALRRHLKINGVIRQIDNFGCQLTERGSRWLEARLPARTAVGDAAQWGEHVLGNAADSVDLVTLYGGLSGLPASQLPDCLAQLYAVVRPGGMVLLLEHDVETAYAGLETSLSVTLAFLCAGETWEASQAHPRAFRGADEWSALMQRHGLMETGTRERIERMPFGDILMAFQKPSGKG